MSRNNKKMNKQMSKQRRTKQIASIVCLILVAAMLITTFVSALFVY